MKIWCVMRGKFRRKKNLLIDPDEHTCPGCHCSRWCSDGGWQWHRAHSIRNPGGDYCNSHHRGPRSEQEAGHGGLCLSVYNDGSWGTSWCEPLYEKHPANTRVLRSDDRAVELFRADNVGARPNRGVASPGWNYHFKNAFVEHICSSRSYHQPLLLQLRNRKEWRPIFFR